MRYTTTRRRRLYPESRLPRRRTESRSALRRYIVEATDAEKWLAKRFGRDEMRWDGLDHDQYTTIADELFRGGHHIHRVSGDEEGYYEFSDGSGIIYSAQGWWDHTDTRGRRSTPDK